MAPRMSLLDGPTHRKCLCGLLESALTEKQSPVSGVGLLKEERMIRVWIMGLPVSTLCRFCSLGWRNVWWFSEVLVWFVGRCQGWGSQTSWRLNNASSYCSAQDLSQPNQREKTGGRDESDVVDLCWNRLRHLMFHLELQWGSSTHTHTHTQNPWSTVNSCSV